MYKEKRDVRNTSNGMTPNKAIRRPTNMASKKPIGKPVIRKTQGK